MQHCLTCGCMTLFLLWISSVNSHQPLRNNWHGWMQKLISHVAPGKATRPLISRMQRQQRNSKRSRNHCAVIWNNKSELQNVVTMQIACPANGSMADLMADTRFKRKCG